MTTTASSREVWGGAGRLAAPSGLVGLFGALAAVLAGPVPARGQDVTWTGAVDATNGDYYFIERTTAVWLSNGIRLRHGVLRLDASLPVVAQNSDAVTRIAGLPVPTGGSHSGDVARRGEGAGAGDGSGAGMATTGANAMLAERRTIVIDEPGSLELEVADPVFGVGVDLAPDGSAFRSVRFGVSAKAPLRDAASGVGTGEWDFGVGAGASVAAGSLILLVDGTWWTLGDLPDLELRDVLSYGAALGGLLGDGAVGWSLSLSGSTAMVEDVEAPLSVGGDVLFWSDRGRSLSLGLRIGLTESAPDVAASVGWAIPLAR